MGGNYLKAMTTPFTKSSMARAISLSFSPSREHSLLGEGSLYGWSLVLQVWIQLLNYTQKQYIGQVQ